MSVEDSWAKRMPHVIKQVFLFPLRQCFGVSILFLRMAAAWRDVSVARWACRKKMKYFKEK